MSTQWEASFRGRTLAEIQDAALDAAADFFGRAVLLSELTIDARSYTVSREMSGKQEIVDYEASVSMEVRK